MVPLSPLGRSRLAFTALIFALYLVASDQTVRTGDPGALFFLAPFIAVVGVGHASSREAMVRAGISVAAIVICGLIASRAHGRGLPDYGNLSALLTAITGLFALNLIILIASSKLVERAWPESDHWTR